MIFKNSVVFSSKFVPTQLWSGIALFTVMDVLYSTIGIIIEYLKNVIQHVPKAYLTIAKFKYGISADNCFVHSPTRLTYF